MSVSVETSARTMVFENISDFRAMLNSVDQGALHVGSDSPDKFHSIMHWAHADEMRISTMDNDFEHSVIRTPELIARDRRMNFRVTLMLAGSCLLVQDGRDAALGIGDFGIVDTARPYSMTVEGGSKIVTLTFAHQLLGLPAGLVSQVTAAQVSGREGVGAVVASYLTQLSRCLLDDRDASRSPVDTSGLTGVHLARSSIDLMAAALSHVLRLEEAVPNPRRALLEQIHAYIDAHLDSPQLGPTSIASAHHISIRYLHGIFQEQGITVSTWIRERRLARCRRDLVNPAYDHLTVAAIASRWNFTEPAHFSRAFKTLYGVSPSAYRATHQNTVATSPQPSYPL